MAYKIDVNETVNRYAERTVYAPQESGEEDGTITLAEVAPGAFEAVRNVLKLHRPCASRSCPQYREHCVECDQKVPCATLREVANGVDPYHWSIPMM